MPRIVEISDDRNLPFRVIFVGDGRTGKTDLFVRLGEYGRWQGNRPPSNGVNVITRTLKISNESVTLRFFDIASGGRMNSMSLTCDFKASVVFVLYDITNRNSFLNIQDWLEGFSKADELGAQIVIVGNKCDLEDEREVSYEEAREFAEKKNFRFIEVSAKTLENVNYLMHLIATDVLARYLKSKEGEKILRLEEKKAQEMIKLKEKNKEKKKSFCAT